MGQYERAAADFALGFEIDPKASCPRFAQANEARIHYPQLPCPAN
jgi:hypothetical protein